MRTRVHLLLIALACTTAACTVKEADEDATSSEETVAQEPGAASTPMPVEPDGGIGDGAPPLEDMVLGQESGLPNSDEAAEEGSQDALPKSFPTALRGKWRETEGAAVTKAQCDGYQQDNMGKVLTVSMCFDKLYLIIFL